MVDGRVSEGVNESETESESDLEGEGVFDGGSRRSNVFPSGEARMVGHVGPTE